VTTEIHLSSDIFIEVLKSGGNLKGLELAGALVIEALGCLFKGVLKGHITLYFTMLHIIDELKTILGVENLDLGTTIDHLESILSRIDVEILERELGQVCKVNRIGEEGPSFMPFNKRLWFLFY
jgi:hypothetical protein